MWLVTGSMVILPWLERARTLDEDTLKTAVVRPRSCHGLVLCLQAKITNLDTVAHTIVRFTFSWQHVESRADDLGSNPGVGTIIIVCSLFKMHSMNEYSALLA